MPSGGEGELAGAGAEIEDHHVVAQAVFAQVRDLVCGLGVLEVVVAVCVGGVDRRWQGARRSPGQSTPRVQRLASRLPECCGGTADEQHHASRWRRTTAVMTMRAAARTTKIAVSMPWKVQ